MNNIKQILIEHLLKIHLGHFNHSAYVEYKPKQKPIIWGIGKTPEHAERDFYKQRPAFSSGKNVSTEHYSVTPGVYNHVYNHGHDENTDNKIFEFDHKHKLIKMKNEYLPDVKRFLNDYNENI